MALNQTLPIPTTTTAHFLCKTKTKTPLTNLQIPSLSLSLSPSSSSISFSNRCLKPLRLKCSVDYNYNYNQTQVEYPRPTEIPWTKEHSNSVHLIGIVGTPVEIKHLPSGNGKALAWTRLAVKKSSTLTSWISLTFWDELAHIAFQHVEKGQQIYVSGRLVSDTVESEDGKQQTYYKVVVQQLNFVERSISSLPLYDRDSNSMMAGKKLGNNAASDMSIEELWQAFFANPVDWWDNRKNKKNPKYPDFKHKDTGEALWVEGRYNPPWVKSQLAILDTRRGSLFDQDARLDANLVPGDKFLPF
ncbi:protein OSB2, chloroplastic-like [Quercus robur]|uniref:protein OSB2, chloroplastic-like n=1 Tax=Quercus robur TaxID=38942 RepID=UPI0021631038|nr:protein OSB2, chloroplastic-like [Quercus robur]